MLNSIRKAVEFALADRVAAVVTNPIQKNTLYQAGFRHKGHTDYLGALCQSSSPPVMMLSCRGLRTVPVSVHVPLSEAVASLSQEAIVTCAETAGNALERDFGCRPARLAVAGLNPHAGEGGALGREEVDIIEPAVATLKQRGRKVLGPFAPDSMFHAAARRRYDAAICMYHDQALIPIKTIDFHRGVNITLGLPIVRTSPDHGTALALAGTGRASAASLERALEIAAAIAKRRAAVPSEQHD